MTSTIDKKADYCSHVIIDFPYAPIGSPLPNNNPPKCTLTGADCIAKEIYHFSLAPYTPQTIYGYDVQRARKCPTFNIPEEIAKTIRDFREVRKQPAEQRGSL